MEADAVDGEEEKLEREIAAEERKSNDDNNVEDESDDTSVPNKEEIVSAFTGNKVQ